MPLPNLDLGITDTRELDSVDAADAFLSGEPLEKIKKKEATAPAKAPKEAEEEAVTADDAAAAFLDDTEEEEEEETEEENPLLKKKAAAEKKEEEKPAEQEEPEANTFEAYAKELYTAGVYTREEGEDETFPQTADELLALAQQQQQKGATRWLEQFLSRNGEEHMQLFEALFINGMDPRDYVPAYSQVLSLQELDLEKETAQEQVFREFYKRSGLSPERIESKLQKAKDYGDLAEEAPELHAQLLEQDKASLQQKEDAKKALDLQKKQQEDQYKAAVQQTLTQALKEKELAGFPVTEKRASEIFRYLTVPAYKTPSGETLTEFDKLILDSKNDASLRAKIALYHLNGWDTSKIEKKALSKESNELFSGLKKKAVKSKTERPAQSHNPWADL